MPAETPEQRREREAAAAAALGRGPIPPYQPREGEATSHSTTVPPAEVPEAPDLSYSTRPGDPMAKAAEREQAAERPTAAPAGASRSAMDNGPAPSGSPPAEGWTIGPEPVEAMMARIEAIADAQRRSAMLCGLSLAVALLAGVLALQAARQAARAPDGAAEGA